MIQLSATDAKRIAALLTFLAQQYTNKLPTRTAEKMRAASLLSQKLNRKIKDEQHKTLSERTTDAMHS
jgi:phytoene/squalene synthetase